MTTLDFKCSSDQGHEVDRASCDAAKYDVVLLPTFSQVEEWRKRAADAQGAGLFSTAVTTFNAWVADLWELHGDGRAIVDSVQRQVVMRAAFAQMAEAQGDEGEDGVNGVSGPAIGGGEDAGLHDACGNEGGSAGGAGGSGAAGLTLSDGVVGLAADCVASAAGVPAFERALAEACGGAVPAGLSENEAVLLQGIGRYVSLLESAGLVELGHAAAALASQNDVVFPRGLSVLFENAAPLGWIAASFLGSCPQLHAEVRLAPGAEGIGRADSAAGLAFGFPSGRYAQPALVADLVRAQLADGGEGLGALPTVVACKDPLALYKQLEAPLSNAGVRLCVQAQVAFASTDFGRAFMLMARMLGDGPWSAADLSDAVRPPFSGFSASEALTIDKELRANRLAQRDECLARLRVASDAFSQLEEVASDPEADILLGVFEQIAFTAPGRSAAWRAEQLAAAQAVRACTAAARRMGAAAAQCARVLENVKVRVSYEGQAESGAEAAAGAEAPIEAPHRVVVTTQAVAAQMGAGSCGQLIVCDLTSEDYPVADKDDAAATLFAKLGLRPADSALARARRTFRALQALPVSRLVLVRPLNDWNGAPTYPCAVLQELVDAYRDDPTSDDDLDELLGLPPALLGAAVQRGEELLFANAGGAASGYAQQVAETAFPTWGDVRASWAADAAVLPRRGEGGRVIAVFSPSPSQVEAYLECPRKWFAQSRLRVEGLDEGFGALERGTFAHEALQRFYRRFREAGRLKVAPENLDAAKALMRELLDELEAEQYRAEPGSGRYVAANQIERREIAACKRQLVDYLDYEARLLPNFHPEHLEFAITPEDGVEYAGHPFMGIVDRIDVDDAGNAVVIDYKGSVGRAHHIAGATDAAPGKVQTRMYAQVVGRLLGLNVVGALYVSYGKAHACAGAFDARALEAAHLPDMRVSACSCAAELPLGQDAPEEHAQLPFGDMLDRTEQVVARAMAAMQAGKVAPAPATQDACAYCPVEACPKRGA